MAAASLLPAEIAVFPLEGALLLPGGLLPLTIFEPRYLAMVDEVLGGPRVIGMVQPDPSAPEGGSGPGLYAVGCLGRLVAFSETGDGRYLITLAGTSRFRIAAELPARHGYRRVAADYAPFAEDLGDAPAPIERAELLRALFAFFAARGLEANWKTIEAMPDARLVNTLAMSCPFEPAEKQALLEARLVERGQALLSLLRMGAHAADGSPPTRPS